MKRTAKAGILWGAAGYGLVAPSPPDSMTDEVSRQINSLIRKRQELKFLRKVLKKRIERLKAQQMSRRQEWAGSGGHKN